MGTNFPRNLRKKITHFHGKLTFHNRLSTSRGRGGERVKQPVKVTNIATSTHTHSFYVSCQKSYFILRAAWVVGEQIEVNEVLGAGNTEIWVYLQDMLYLPRAPTPRGATPFSQRGPLFLDKLNCSMMWLVSRLNRVSGFKKGKMESYPTNLNNFKLYVLILPNKKKKQMLRKFSKTKSHFTPPFP